MARAGNRLAQAVKGEKRERIRSDPLVHLRKIHPRRDELLTCGRVDAVKARPQHLRARDAQVHLDGSRIAQHRHELARGAATHDRVIDDDEPLSRDHIG